MSIATKKWSSSDNKNFVIDIESHNKRFDFIGTFNSLGRNVVKIEGVLKDTAIKLNLFREGKLTEPMGIVREELRLQVEKCGKTFDTFTEFLEKEAPYYEITEKESLRQLRDRFKLMWHKFERLDEELSYSTSEKLLTNVSLGSLGGEASRIPRMVCLAGLVCIIILGSQIVRTLQPPS
ncbi:MAG: hypothetical protein V4487_08470 [Chlamydiota bacterium]